MKEFWKKTFYSALPLFIGLTLTVICFFIIFRYGGLIKGFDRILSILMPFIYGGVIAYLLKTPFNWIEDKLLKKMGEKRRGLVKALSLIIVLVLSFAVLLILLSMVIPALVSSIISIVKEVPGALSKFTAFISQYTEDNRVLQNYINRATEAVNTNGLKWIKEKILPELGALMGNFANVFGSFFGLLYNLFIGLIICIYLLLGKDNFARQGKMFIYAVFPKNKAEWLLEELKFIDKTFVGFFAGKILDSTVMGLICYAFCLIMQFGFGMKNAVLIAVIVGVTNIIPFFGPYIGAVPSALIILMDSPFCCVIFLIFIIILQQIDGNVIGPMLLSNSVGLSGFWVLFAITFFGGLFGIVGIFTGVPVFAVIYDLVRRWVHKMLKKHGADNLIPDKDNELPARKEKDPEQVQQL